MIATEVLIGLSLAALLALAIPFVVYFGWRRRMELRLRNVLVGVAIFVVFVIVLEGAMHAYLLTGNPVTKAWFAAYPIGMALYAALAAGLFEETGRYLGLRYLAKAVPGNGTPVAYGIGHGGAECVLIAVNITVIAVLGYLMTVGKFDSLGIPEDAAAAVRTSLTGATFATSLLGGVERVFAVIFQIAFSLIIWQAVRLRSVFYYLLAVAAHFAVDLPAALAQQKLLPISILELEAAYGLLALLALVGMWAFARPAENEAPRPA